MRNILLTLIILITSCQQDQVFIPKPRMYPKVIFPSKNNVEFKQSECAFTFEIPDYFEFVQDTVELENINQKCWFDLYCKDLNAYIHFSYHDIKNRTHFDKLVQDAFEMANKHNIKAHSRAESRYDNNEEDVHGLVFDITGPVAAPLQFFLTDSTDHFLRGSLYFKSQVNRDSLNPVFNYLKDDVMNVVNTFNWTSS